MPCQFKVATVHANAVIPTRATSGSAGLDLSSVEDVVIPPSSWKSISTGIIVSIPVDAYARIAPRSGLAFRHGLAIGAGVVDSDFRGPIKVIMFNHGATEFAVKTGDRIAQLILEKIYTIDPVLVIPSEIDETSRGSGGFGSTGL